MNTAKPERKYSSVVAAQYASSAARRRPRCLHSGKGGTPRAARRSFADTASACSRTRIAHSMGTSSMTWPVRMSVA